MKSNKSTHYELMKPHEVPNLSVGDLRVFVNKYQPDDVCMVSPKGYAEMIKSLVRGKSFDIAIEFERAELLAKEILEILEDSEDPKSEIRKHIFSEFGLSDEPPIQQSEHFCIECGEPTEEGKKQCDDCRNVTE